MNLDDLVGIDSIGPSAVAKGFLFLSSAFEHHSRASIERESDLNYVLRIIGIKLGRRGRRGQNWKREVTFKAILLILVRDGA